jgi:hypothetical protein
MSSDTSKVNTRGTCDCWQDKQSHEVNATLVRPLTFITTYISRFSIPIYLTSSIDSPRAYHHDSRLTNMKAECSSGRNASQTSTWISHAGEAIRVTLLCSITAPPPVYSNRQRHPAFTVAIHDQPRTKSTRAAVSTSARTEHRYLKPASRDANLHKPPSTHHISTLKPSGSCTRHALAGSFLCSIKTDGVNNAIQLPVAE